MILRSKLFLPPQNSFAFRYFALKKPIKLICSSIFLVTLYIILALANKGLNSRWVEPEMIILRISPLSDIIQSLELKKLSGFDSSQKHELPAHRYHFHIHWPQFLKLCPHLISCTGCNIFVNCNTYNHNFSYVFLSYVVQNRVLLLMLTSNEPGKEENAG